VKCCSSHNVIDFGVSQQRVCDFLLVGPVLRRCKDNAGFLHSTLFHFGGAPVGPEVLIVHVGVSPSMYLKLISREIIFEVFQPVWSRYLNVTDWQTDRRTTYCGITALCIASRGKITLMTTVVVYVRPTPKTVIKNY